MWNGYLCSTQSSANKINDGLLDFLAYKTRKSTFNVNMHITLGWAEASPTQVIISIEIFLFIYIMYSATKQESKTLFSKFLAFSL